MFQLIKSSCARLHGNSEIIKEKEFVVSRNRSRLEGIWYLNKFEDCFGEFYLNVLGMPLNAFFSSIRRIDD